MIEHPRISYDPVTGIFTAKVSAGRRKAGDVLGYVKADGYRLVQFNGKWKYAHRLAWFFMTGEWPKAEIDHINGARDDNRFANLREATRSQNMMNSAKRGVCFHKRQGKWTASIRVNGKRTHIGTFASEAAALAAYDRTAKVMHGDFAFIEPRAPEPVQEALL